MICSSSAYIARAPGNLEYRRFNTGLTILRSDGIGPQDVAHAYGYFCAPEHRLRLGSAVTVMGSAEVSFASPTGIANYQRLLSPRCAALIETRFEVVAAG